MEVFSSVFTHEDTHSIQWLGGSPAKNKITDIKVSVEGVKKLLQNLKPNKAAGPDRIPNRVLKELAEELAPIIAALIHTVA